MCVTHTSPEQSTHTQHISYFVSGLKKILQAAARYPEDKKRFPNTPPSLSGFTEIKQKSNYQWKLEIAVNTFYTIPCDSGSWPTMEQEGKTDWHLILKIIKCMKTTLKSHTGFSSDHLRSAITSSPGFHGMCTQRAPQNSPGTQSVVLEKFPHPCHRFLQQLPVLVQNCSWRGQQEIPVLGK